MTSKAFDPTKPVQTRGGLKAVILQADRTSDTYTIAGAYQDEVGDWITTTYTAEGSLLDGEWDDLDLINIPQVPEYLKGTRTWYMNLGKGLSTLDGAMGSTSFDWPVMSVTITDGKVVSTELFDDTGKPL